MSLREMCRQAGVSYHAVHKRCSRHGLSPEEAIEEVKNGKRHTYSRKHPCKKIEGITVLDYAKKYGISESTAYRHWHAIND